jgi:hypothetical protein
VSALAVTAACMLSTPRLAEPQAGGWEKFSIPPPVWAIGDFWVFEAHSAREAVSWTWTVDRLQRIDGTDFYVLKDEEGGWESFWRVNDLAFYMDLHKGQMQSRYVPPLIPRATAHAAAVIPQNVRSRGQRWPRRAAAPR